MRHRLLLIAIAACGKSGSTADKGSAAPVVADAAVVAPRAVAPLPFRTEELDPEIHAAVAAALVAHSGGTCKTARPRAIYTAIVDDAAGHLIGLDCGERGAKMIGLVRHDGKTATVLAAARITAAGVRVDGILADDKRTCLQYSHLDGIRITKNLRHCFPKGGDAEIPTLALPPDPTATLPVWTAPDEVVTAAKVRVYEEVQTCQDATQRPPEVTYAVTYGARKWIAVSCGDLARPSNGLALFEVRGRELALIVYSLDADTTTIEMAGIRASDRVGCLDYKQLPTDDRAELCFAIY